MQNSRPWLATSSLPGQWPNVIQVIYQVLSEELPTVPHWALPCFQGSCHTGHLLALDMPRAPCTMRPLPMLFPLSGTLFPVILISASSVVQNLVIL